MAISVQAWHWQEAMRAFDSNNVTPCGTQRFIDCHRAGGGRGAMTPRSETDSTASAQTALTGLTATTASTGSSAPSRAAWELQSRHCLDLHDVQSYAMQTGSSGSRLREARERVRKSASLVEDQCALVTFLEPDTGELRNITFTTRPIGLDLTRKHPVHVKSVAPRSSGRLLGVQPGWLVLNICGEDVSASNFEQVVELLREAVRTLPQSQLPQHASRASRMAELLATEAKQPSRLASLNAQLFQQSIADDPADSNCQGFEEPPPHVLVDVASTPSTGSDSREATPPRDTSGVHIVQCSEDVPCCDARHAGHSWLVTAASLLFGDGKDARQRSQVTGDGWVESI